MRATTPIAAMPVAEARGPLAALLAIGQSAAPNPWETRCTAP